MRLWIRLSLKSWRKSFFFERVSNKWHFSEAGFWLEELKLKIYQQKEFPLLIYLVFFKRLKSGIRNQELMWCCSACVLDGMRVHMSTHKNNSYSYSPLLQIRHQSHPPAQSFWLLNSFSSDCRLKSSFLSLFEISPDSSLNQQFRHSGSWRVFKPRFGRFCIVWRQINDSEDWCLALFCCVGFTE